MKKMKALTTLVCAFAALAFSAGAWAQNDDVLDEDHIDDPSNGKYVFWDEEEMNEFLLEHAASVESAYDDEGGGVLDVCFTSRPIAYAVTTRHDEGTENEHTHVDLNVVWDSLSSVYTVCAGGHMYSDVDGLRVNWKTTSASDCDYCDWNDWSAKHYYPDYQEMSYVQDCVYIIYTSIIVYWGEERADFNNHDFVIDENVAKFNRDGTSTDSMVEMVDCVW